MEQNRPPMKPEPAPLSAHIPQNTPAPAPWRESTPAQSRRAGPPRLQTEPPAAPRSASPRRGPVAPLVSLLVIGGVAVLAIPLLFVLYEAANGWPSLAAAPVAPVAAPAQPASPTAPLVAASTEAPASAAVGSARPRPTPTRRQRADALAAKGIELLQEGNAQAAALLFQDALSLDPASADGNYGLGYTLLHQGDSQGALPYICTAASTGNDAARRQALALLQANSLACP
ncbi:MAG: hypothetical protein KTR31_16980 [Myxococcales bacterium]|nr:hypothetical protein [Myxococcales bacterium]